MGVEQNVQFDVECTDTTPLPYVMRGLNYRPCTLKPSINSMECHVARRSSMWITLSIFCSSSASIPVLRNVHLKHVTLFVLRILVSWHVPIVWLRLDKPL